MGAAAIGSRSHETTRKGRLLALQQCLPSLGPHGDMQQHGSRSLSIVAEWRVLLLRGRLSRGTKETVNPVHSACMTERRGVLLRGRLSRGTKETVNPVHSAC